MQTDVERRFPREACGLIASQEGLPVEVIPVTNLLNSPTRFRMDPREQFEAFNLIEKRGWELLAIYHSHPNGPENPSATDLDEWYYPEAFALIWFPQALGWTCRAFQISELGAQEINIHLRE
jgi:proteasome lid subunit RPN8/RPN11